jgi:hypothetical protein
LAAEHIWRWYSEVIIIPDAGHLPMIEQPKTCARDYLKFRQSLANSDASFCSPSKLGGTCPAISGAPGKSASLLAPGTAGASASISRKWRLIRKWSLSAQQAVWRP